MFKFRTATGVLKISLKQIPAGATKLVLTSKTATDALSGEWLFAEDETYTNGIQMGTGNKNYTNTKTVTFSDLSGLDSYTDFYVPIPVGTINGLIIDIKKDDATLLWRVSTDEALTITRGVVTELPGINMTGKALTVTVGTTSDDPSIKITNSGYTRVCATVNTTATNNDKDAYPAGLWFSTSTDYKVSTWDAGHTDLLADKNSGLFYLHYVALSSAIEANTLTDLNDKRVKAYGTIPFYFLNADDVTAIVGNWTHATSDGCQLSGSGFPSTSNFTLVSSTSPTSSNVMVSQFDGLDCTYKIGGIYIDGSGKIDLSNRYYFDSTHYFARTSNEATHLNLVFTSAAKTAFYPDSNFGLKTNDSWTYYYTAGNSHLYTK